MRNGDWQPGTQIAFGRMPDGSLHLVNGQHRMRAAIEARHASEYQILICDCSDENELAALYYKFDRSARIRSLSEVANAANLSEEYNLSKSMTVAVLSAVPILAYNLKVVSYTHEPIIRDDDWKIEKAAEWWSAARLYETAISRAEIGMPRRLRGVYVTAAALATLRFQEKTAFEFWKGVAENDGLSRGDPRRALSVALLSRSFKTGRMDAPLILSCNSWNAWFTGKSLQQAKVHDESVARLLGTPFSGKQS